MTQAERTVLFNPSEARQARLVGVSGTVKGKVIPLSLGTFVIGRGEECDLRLRDAGVSRVHAKIVAEGPVFVVQDHESRNGTLVNGQPVRRADLKEGDQLALCSAIFRFTYKEVAPQPLPPEFEDNTDEVEEAPPHAVTSPGIRLPGSAPALTAAPTERGTRTLALVAAIGSITAIVGVGVVVAVVLSRPPPVVVVQGGSDPKAGLEVPSLARDAGAAGDRASATPTPAPTPTLDAGAAPAAPGDAGQAVDIVDAGVAAAEAPDEPTRKGSGRKSGGAAVTAWVPLRTGPEVARAPADGKIVSIARRAEAGQPFLAIEGQPPIAAPASGDVAATVKAGDTVRRGQVVGRIAETRARAELPASLRKRARAGVAVELRLTDGSTRSASIVAVVGSTVFVETGGASVQSLRLR